MQVRAVTSHGGEGRSADPPPTSCRSAGGFARSRIRSTVLEQATLTLWTAQHPKSNTTSNTHLPRRTRHCSPHDNHFIPSPLVTIARSAKSHFLTFPQSKRQRIASPKRIHWAMELLCVENTRECYAYPDPALLNDSRVLDNLLRCEEQYLLPQNYLEKGVGGSSITVTEVRPDMRNTVAEWMFEVSSSSLFPGLIINSFPRRI